MLNSSIFFANKNNVFFAFFVVFALSACQTLDTQKHWPDDIPKRSIFVKDFLKKKNLKKADSAILDDHLIWVIRFYHGTVIYPNGWNRASKMLLASVDDEKTKKIVSKKISKLGIRIVNEWAQDNVDRNINSANIATWGSALKTSADRNDQIGFLNKIEADVEDLISRKLSTNDISYSRYYPEDDYDSF